MLICSIKNINESLLFFNVATFFIQPTTTTNLTTKLNYKLNYRLGFDTITYF